jgi:hypothetical protein
MDSASRRSRDARSHRSDEGRVPRRRRRDSDSNAHSDSPGPRVYDGNNVLLGNILAMNRNNIQFRTSTGHVMIVNYDGTISNGQIYYSGGGCTGAAWLNSGSASALPLHRSTVVYSGSFGTLMVPTNIGANDTSPLESFTSATIDNPACGTSAGGPRTPRVSGVTSTRAARRRSIPRMVRPAVPSAADARSSGAPVTRSLELSKGDAAPISPAPRARLDVLTPPVARLGADACVAPLEPSFQRAGLVALTEQLRSEDVSVRQGALRMLRKAPHGTLRDPSLLLAVLAARDDRRTVSLAEAALSRFAPITARARVAVEALIAQPPPWCPTWTSADDACAPLASQLAGGLLGSLPGVQLIVSHVARPHPELEVLVTEAFHCFVALPHPGGREIIIDPTYQQFLGGDHPGLPAVFVGTAQDLRDLFRTQLSALKPQNPHAIPVDAQGRFDVDAFVSRTWGLGEFADARTDSTAELRRHVASDSSRA